MPQSPLARPRVLPLLALLLLPFAAGCGDEPAEPDRPRVVLVAVLDTLSSQHISHLGYDRATTPNLDALAADGVSFAQAVTSATYTLASIPSVLTGRLPDRHGVTDYARRLADDETTLAELLRAVGYRTRGIVAVANGGPAYGNEQGFDDFEEIYLGPGPEGAEVFEHKDRVVHMAKADEFLPAIEQRLDELGPDERLFLYLHVLEPHGPYDPPLEYKQHFVDERAPTPYEEGDRLRIQKALKETDDPAVRAELVRLYDANIRWADENLGLALDALRERGLYEDTLVAVTSDHGESFWEKDDIAGHGRSVYEAEVRVPLILKLPGADAPRGLRVDALASNIDLLPTLGELLALPVPGNRLDGHSLVPLLREGGRPPREQIVTRTNMTASRYSLRTATEKVVVEVEVAEDGTLSPTVIELYDLTQDPTEQVDLAEQRPERAQELAAELVRTAQELRAQQRAVKGHMPGADARLLNALGYTDIMDSE